MKFYLTTLLGAIEWRFVLRIWAGTILVGIGWFYAARGMRIIDYGLGFINGVCFFAMAALLIVPVVIRRMVDAVASFFGPNARNDRPVPIYGVPRGNRKYFGRYEEAFNDYQAMVQQHPQELQAYIEMIDIAVVDMKKPELARAIYQQALAVLIQANDREELERVVKGWLGLGVASGKSVE